MSPTLKILFKTQHIVIIQVQTFQKLREGKYLPHPQFTPFSSGSNHCEEFGYILRLNIAYVVFSHRWNHTLHTAMMCWGLTTVFTSFLRFNSTSLSLLRCTLTDLARPVGGYLDSLLLSRAISTL